MATPVEPKLGAAQVNDLRERGFLALDAITTPDEVAWQSDAHEALLEDRRPLRLRYRTGAQRRIDQIFSPELQRPRLLETQCLANARCLGARAALPLPLSARGTSARASRCVRV
jgi:hypothetical protein